MFSRKTGSRYDVRKNIDYSLCRPGNVQVVVIMGGLGTRLREITSECPKALVDVNGKPFFEYELQLLVREGFQKYVFCVGYLGTMIQAYFGDGSRYGVSIQYSFEEEKLLGTGGAIRKAADLLDENFMTIYADSFMDVDYKEIIYKYAVGKCRGKCALMAVYRNDGRYDKSNVVYENGQIILYDKDKNINTMHYIDYGIGMFEKSLFLDYGMDVKFDLALIQHSLSVEGKLEGVEVFRRFYEIGNNISYNEFCDYAKKRFGTPRSAVFFDRDGVINEMVFNEDTEQLDSPLKKEQFQLKPGALKMLEEVHALGYYVFIVTNQPAAAKGKTTFGNLCDINHLLLEMAGETVDEIVVCPHYPQNQKYTREIFLIEDCGCRKPKTGLIDKICGKYNIDKKNSYMVGDSYTDIMCGKDSGLKTIFIGSYKCDMCRLLNHNKPDYVVDRIEEICELVGLGI